jgi:hypothetical protein
MFDVIDHSLKAIKHIQNQVLGGLDVIMSSNFYEELPVKDCWIF